VRNVSFENTLAQAEACVQNHTYTHTHKTGAGQRQNNNEIPDTKY